MTDKEINNEALKISIIRGSYERKVAIIELLRKLKVDFLSDKEEINNECNVDCDLKHFRDVDGRVPCCKTWRTFSDGTDLLPCTEGDCKKEIWEYVHNLKQKGIKLKASEIKIQYEIISRKYKLSIDWMTGKFKKIL